MRPRPPATSSGLPRERKRFAHLAAELAELAAGAPGDLGPQLAALSMRELAEVALRLPANLRLELLLHAPRPMRLVRSLPDSELYLTLREVGPADALPLLALGSASQLLHLVDVESWRGDRFDADRCGAWIALLLEAGEPALRRFLRAADDELLALLFQRWLRVEEIETEIHADVHGHGQTESGDERGLSSPDGAYRLRPTIAEHGPAAQRVAQIFYQDQPGRYHQVLWSAIWELPGALEEEALQWRQSRLEENGYPPWDEALSVYARPEGIRVIPEPLEPSDPDGLPAARAPLRVLPANDPLVEAIESLPDPERERVLHQLAAVATRLMVADGADTGDPSSHRGALEKAAGYISIALAAREADGPARIGHVLEEIPLIELVREGYARTAELQERARELTREGWAAAHPRALDLLNAPLRGRVLGLLEPRPLYQEIRDDDSTTLRSFRSLGEVEQTRIAFEMAELIGRLMVSQLGLDVERVLVEAQDADPPRFGTFFVTLLAWHAARQELRGDALPPDVVADFLRNVVSRRTADPEASSRAFEMLVRELGGRFELSQREQALLGAFGRSCLERLTAECGSLDPSVPVDRRRVSCLLVREAKDS